ncbi:glycosyltransferase family 4 protein [Psychroflexus sp. YR1-1]|uniref:Glycosyltransferase family 4 protein n=1 Tax=Psychroflexus aurantiacus TaxID=2709310 RepID=A0A6B3R8G7_9FLAO|nr:glycosyltransferase family 4 protein [Psychroflexus aurantiacus]NEV93941.1 glycosyltransferase family 4 protein [Psychroflexus aurantiacus]
MKILMVSMPSLHFFRWTEQLKDAGHEIYWFNITDSGKFEGRLDWVQQKFAWRLKWDFPGRVYIKKEFPKLSRYIQTVNTNSTPKAFENYLHEIKPDVVHSFALYVSCTSVLSVMENHPRIPWIYSSWGSDLYYFQNFKAYLKDIQAVLPRVDYLFTDCQRDYTIARTYGFKGEFLGVLPGGGGFKFDSTKPLKPPGERKIILIKGFQGRSGRAIPVLKAIQRLQQEILNYHVVVFGADREVVEFVKNEKIKTWFNIEVIGRIKYDEVIEFMQKALIYIGNSNSDGLPNTMLEAICFGAFPIQSNPGGASAEIINHGENGLLIKDCKNIDEIKNHLTTALNDKDLTNKAFKKNLKIRLDLEYEIIKAQVLKAYQNINSQ